MAPKDWFKKVFGFTEVTYLKAQQTFELEGEKLKSLRNQRTYHIGTFTTPSVNDLRATFDELVEYTDEKSLTLTHIAVNDIYLTHFDPQYAGAMFQVASQFNCLEFVSSAVTPERGITSYVYDHTQGPACSLACSAATVYRNYFAKTPNGNIGQTRNDQINNLDLIEDHIGNIENKYWKVTNGYTFSTKQDLSRLRNLITNQPEILGEFIGKLKIGVHNDVDAFDIWDKNHSNYQPVQRVSQSFCSAISISYSGISGEDWKPLALPVLHGAYEATVLAGAINYLKKEGSNIIVLSFVGGGVFGNDLDWIAEAIGRACAICAFVSLDVRIAHYRRIDLYLSKKIDDYFNLYLNKFYGDDMMLDRNSLISLRGNFISNKL